MATINNSNVYSYSCNFKKILKSFWRNLYLIIEYFYVVVIISFYVILYKSSP